MWKFSEDYLTNLLLPRIPCVLQQVLEVGHKMRGQLIAAFSDQCGMGLALGFLMGIVTILAMLILLPEFDRLISWWDGSRKKTDD